MTKPKLPAGPKRRRSSGLIRQMTKSALLAVGLNAAQLLASEHSWRPMFAPGMIDRLKAPLTWYRE